MKSTVRSMDGLIGRYKDDDTDLPGAPLTCIPLVRPTF